MKRSSFVVSALMGALLMSLIVRPVTAQTTQVVPTNTPITVAFESSQSTSDVSFRALVDGTITKNFAATDLTVVNAPLTACETGATTCFTYTGIIPGVSRGAHKLLIRSFNELGQKDSPELSFTAAVAPKAPSIPRISISVTTAGITIDVKDQRGTQTAVLNIPK